MNIMYKPYVESLYTFGTMEKLLNKNKMNKNNRKFKTLYYKKKKIDSFSKTTTWF